MLRKLDFLLKGGVVSQNCLVRNQVVPSQGRPSFFWSHDQNIWGKVSVLLEFVEATPVVKFSSKFERVRTFRTLCFCRSMVLGVREGPGRVVSKFEENL